MDKTPQHIYQGNSLLASLYSVNRQQQEEYEKNVRSTIYWAYKQNTAPQSTGSTVQEVKKGLQPFLHNSQHDRVLC